MHSAQPLRIDRVTEGAIRRFLSLIASRYDMAGANLYGSRALGKHRPDSDADVLVILKGEHQRVLPTTLAMADATYDVLLETDINISPLPVWLDDWDHPENRVPGNHQKTGGALGAVVRATVEGGAGGVVARRASGGAR